MHRLFLPEDAVTGPRIDFDLAADFLELSALFSTDAAVLTSELANGTSIGAAEDHPDVDHEMKHGEEEVVSGAVERMAMRDRVLDGAYPFRLDGPGEVLTCHLVEGSIEQAAYILSLVLSNLRAVSPVLNSSDLHPDEKEVRKLREYFQYFATAAMAAEIQGHAWSFGFPRPDRSPFLGKLEQIWRQLGDGCVTAQAGAPQQPKDDQVDVFAARPHPDRLPGFPLAAAQVATGRDAREKSLKGHLSVFKSRWFGTQPVTDFIPYMVMPFATADNHFTDDVRRMGNVLHRLRVPRRVAEAAGLVNAGVTIEGYDRLAEAARWVSDYRNRAAVVA